VKEKVVLLKQVKGLQHNKIRGQVITRRTYNRPLNNEGTIFETWEETIERVIGHQRWLWKRAKRLPLNDEEIEELSALRRLLLSRKSSVSGRTLWLGGTAVARKREASQFNCAGHILETINDSVDQIWLLMQGCGVGFHSNKGILNGFSKNIPEIEVIRSELTKKREGVDDNIETFDGVHWTISVGDSAEAWAKAFGKLLAGKFRAEKLTFDFSRIRPAGERLKGYGWISSGDSSISIAMPAIAEILNKRAGKLLTRIDLLDVGNWMGTVLSSRRSAEIAFHRFGEEEWEEFAVAKRDQPGNEQRFQSNNSLLFYHKPTKLEIRGLFEMMLEGEEGTPGRGSEPGFINAEEALRRAPWFKLLNPCAEILLGNKSFCNLVETNLAAFNGQFRELKQALHLIGRANYRQTCVDLRDGILQDSWHELNQFLRLTGVGVTGIVGWEFQSVPDAWKELRGIAQGAVNSMADELNLPRSKAVTTIKPSGTLSKVMGTTEGIHKPLGKYIFNNIIFAKADPLVPKLRGAGYDIVDSPRDTESCIVKFPIVWDNVSFDKVNSKGVQLEVNTDSAVIQLNRYKLVMDNYVDHNCSITVSYDPSEVPEIVDWLHKNWESYVGVSWLLRDDPTKTAEDLGFDYLPQDVTTKEKWEEYASKLREFSFDGTETFEELEDNECSTGICPVK